MAWSSIGTLGASGNKTANSSSITHTIVTTSPSAGDVVVIALAVDNNQTTDGDEGAVTSVTDSSGSNSYSKALEFCNGQGSAQAGVTCSVWYSQLTTGLTASSSTITMNLSNSSARDAQCVTAWCFRMAGGSTVSVGASNSSAVDGGAIDSLNATTSSAEFLRYRVCGAETGDSTDITATASWTLLTAGASGGSGSGATKQAIRGEFHISTGTGDASGPTWSGNTDDKASVYIAFLETAGGGGGGRTTKNTRAYPLGVEIGMDWRSGGDL